MLHRQADAGAGAVSLTSRECQLLWELMRQPGKVVPKEDLLAGLGLEIRTARPM